MSMAHGRPKILKLRAWEQLELEFNLKYKLARFNFQVSINLFVTVYDDKGI